ncbi:hypothetical protein PHMEG_00031127 [Phytophthora megakarya]|uniref:Uncharacterized protein n=1 Tax=Phytophthora megakarya TaxID=4795 RepID=A0A225UYR3_9STRA|nr:hypothetical protein PHMEG_00031127 [Phytophthora megakarya]
MWIADLNATRLGFGTAQDLLGVQIPTALCEARQCAALLQTLLFEAGFQFDNVISEWFRTRASKISADKFGWILRSFNVFCKSNSLNGISSRMEFTTRSEQSQERWSSENLRTC